MLPRLILLVGLTLSTAAAADSSNSPGSSKTLWNGTGTGGILVPGAEIQRRHMAVTAFGSYVNQGGLVNPGDEVTRYRYGVGAAYSPLDFLEIGGNVAGSSTTNSLGTPKNLSTFGDAILAAKGNYVINENFATALRGDLRLFSGIAGESGYGDTASYAVEWLGTTRVGNFAAHLEAGYLYDRTVNFIARRPTPIERFAWGQSDFNQALYGLSLNYETGFADYTVEFSGEKPLGGGAPAFSDSPLRVTPGLRFRPWGPLEIQVAGNVSLTDVSMAQRSAMSIPAQPSYDILGALRWNVNFERAAMVENEPAPAPQAEPEVAPVPAPVTPPTEAAPPVTAAAPAGIRGALVGRILNMATGDPVPSATVTVESTGASQQASATGNFVIPNLPLGPVRIRVEAPDMQTVAMTGEIKAAGLNSLDVGMQPKITTGTLQALVLDKAGKPVAEAEILVDGKLAGKTDAGGRLDAPNIDAGTHEILARKAGFMPANASFVEIVAGQSVSETMTLEAELRPGFIEVKAVNEDRQPVAAIVTVEGQPDLKRVLDPAAGSTTTLKVKPGMYRIQVEAPGYITETQEITVPEDGELALRFKLKK
jgi:hypothetical protein